MQGQMLAPAFLVLAVTLSWRRFVSIFRPSTDAAMATSPSTMIASATSLSAFGLAFSGNDPWLGAFIVVFGSLLGSVMPVRASAMSVALSAASLALYLELSPVFA
ncbi:hypothetical protein [Rhizobium sp. A37_96]